MKRLVYYTVALLSLSSCGGGSSSDGMLIEGQLNQGEAVAHSAAIRHSSGEHIEAVKICALGECSTTDSEGNWGFVANEDFTGGDVEFTIQGHGIDGKTVVTIPNGATSVFINFEHGEGNEVVAEDVAFEGVVEDDHDHSEHDHSEHEHQDE